MGMSAMRYFSVQCPQAQARAEHTTLYTAQVLQDYVRYNNIVHNALNVIATKAEYIRSTNTWGCAVFESVPISS